MYILYEITLAKEAISVPIPPMLTPKSTSLQLLVNPDTSIEQGTLLTTWLSIIEEKYGILGLCIKSFKYDCINSILEMFPMNIKKHIKVANKKS